MSDDTDATGTINRFGPFGVSPAGARPGKMTVRVKNKCTTGTDYSEGYVPLVNTDNNTFPFPSRTIVLGGYMLSHPAYDPGAHEITGLISDDVVGEVPDKTVKSANSGHFGGFAAEKPVVL